jgi:hypothetical protein
VLDQSATEAAAVTGDCCVWAVVLRLLFLLLAY